MAKFLLTLCREAISASDAKTGVERRHHLTFALHFGVAALEGFLNRQMRGSASLFEHWELSTDGFVSEEMWKKQKSDYI